MNGLRDGLVVLWPGSMAVSMMLYLEQSRWFFKRIVKHNWLNWQFDVVSSYDQDASRKFVHFLRILALSQILFLLS